MTPEKRSELITQFLGSCGMIEEWDEDYYGLYHDKILEILEEAGIVMCDYCGLWLKQSDTDSSSGDVVCVECQKENLT